MKFEKVMLKQKKLRNFKKKNMMSKQKSFRVDPLQQVEHLLEIENRDYFLISIQEKQLFMSKLKSKRQRNNTMDTSARNRRRENLFEKSLVNFL